jgi:subtilase family serine protease
MKKNTIITSIICSLLSICLITGSSNKENNISRYAHPYTQATNYSVVTATYQRGYQPFQIKHAYGIDKLNVTGKGQKIAIIVAYGSPTIEEDLKIFNNQFDLHTSQLQIAYPNGIPTTTDANWAIETSLDVEWAHALAPQASILLVVANSDSTDDLLNAVDYASDNGAHIISMSWGINEFENESSFDNHFEHANTVYVASSGDNGPEVNWPAVSPNVLAVGGTKLSLDTNGNRIKKETAWYGSGTGISMYEHEPDYQIDYGILTNNYRVIPDVSFDADISTGVAVCCSSIPQSNGKWLVFGGTSLGAPAWAAIIALANERRNNPLTKINNKLYTLAKKRQYCTSHKNVIVEKNEPIKLTDTHRYYNYVTGLGSPIVHNLYMSLIK